MHGTVHVIVYKITRIAFEYSNKTRELSSSTQTSLAQCCNAVTHELNRSSRASLVVPRVLPDLTNEASVKSA